MKAETTHSIFFFTLKSPKHQTMVMRPCMLELPLTAQDKDYFKANY
jgi:hypothetical protein